MRFERKPVQGSLVSYVILKYLEILIKYIYKAITRIYNEHSDFNRIFK